MTQSTYKFEWDGQDAYIVARNRKQAMIHAVRKLREYGYLRPKMWPVGAKCIVWSYVPPGATLWDAL